MTDAYETLLQQQKVTGVVLHLKFKLKVCTNVKACSYTFKKPFKTVSFHSYSLLNGIIWGVRRKEAGGRGTVYQNNI